MIYLLSYRILFEYFLLSCIKCKLHVRALTSAKSTNTICYSLRRFPGHLNDTNCFRMMPSIGPGCDLPLPEDCHIMADLGYPPHPVLVRPKKRNQVRNARQQRINQELRKCRVKVEHAIGFFKTYRSISSRWRNRKAFLSIVIHCCACLSNRRRRFLMRLLLNIFDYKARCDLQS